MSKPRKDGNYVATRRLGEKRIYAYSKVSQADADHNLNLKLQSLEKPREVATVRDAFREHIFPRWQNVSKGTRHKYESDFKYIDLYIGSCPLDALSVKGAHVIAQDFVYALQRTMVSRNGKGTDLKPMAPMTVHHIFDLMAASAEILVVLGVLTMNPFNRRVLSLPAKPAKREKFIDVFEAEKKLEAVPIDSLLLVWFGMVLALREGEIAGLQWSKLNRQTRQLRIDVQRDKYGDLTDPKAGRKRTLGPLPQAFIDFIDKHGDLDSEFIVTNSKGRPWRTNKIYQRWTTIRGELGMGDWTFHDLRHAAAGLLTHMTGDPRTASTVLGHASIDTTAIYIAEQAARSEDGFEKLARLARR